MRLVITADLHYDSPKSRLATEALAAEICRAGGDALVLAGDSASAMHEPMRDCLRLFETFPGRRFFVPGNHCIWCLPGEDSMDRYNRILPLLAQECGFVMLDHAPAVLGDVGLAGSIGWYDYSYRDESLGIPLRFYRAKIAPAAAARLSEHRHLVDEYPDDLTPAGRDIGTRWMDGVRVKMPYSDEEFLDLVVSRLRQQLAALQSDDRVRQVVACTHHVPFRQILPTGRPAAIAFAAAYLGSDRIGEALAGCDKLTHVYCGHSHWPAREQIGKIQVVNVGSTYYEKRYEVLDLP